MKPLITICLLLSSFGVVAQRNTKFELMSYGNSKEIFSFSMTGDTCILKPIDTSYYTIGNQIYREVTYKFTDVKPKELIIRSYNSGHNNWVMFGFMVFDDDKKNK